MQHVACAELVDRTLRRQEDANDLAVQGAKALMHHMLWL